MKYEDMVVMRWPTCPVCDTEHPLGAPCPLDPRPPYKSVWPEGRKDDGGKARYDLLPPELMEGVARVLTFGADKYGERNWEQGMRWGRPFAALMRHMWAWWRGQGRDPETGMSHLWHAACCLAFLIAYEERREGTDDRPEKKVPDPTQST